MRRGMIQLGLLAGLMGLYLGQALPARATILAQSNVPFSATVMDPCTGECVAITGVSHMVVEFTNNGAGGGVFGIHDNEHDVSGVGLTTGTKYTGTGTSENVSFSGPLPLTSTFVVDTELISQGSAPNFRIHTLVHFTIDANNNLTSSVGNITTTCE